MTKFALKLGFTKACSERPLDALELFALRPLSPSSFSIRVSSSSLVPLKLKGRHARSSMDAATGIANAIVGSCFAASSFTVPHFLSADPALAAPSSVLRCHFGHTLGLGSFEYQRLPGKSRTESFAMSCGGEGERDMSPSALAEGIADSLDNSSLEMDLNKEPSISTILTTVENPIDPYGALSTPLYLTATFKQTSATENGPYDYTRSGNPTRDVLQSLLAKLDGADRAFCFTSGMAALSTITSLIVSGQEIVAGEDIYGGSDRLLSQVVPRKGVMVKRVDTSDLHKVASAIGPKTKLVWLESPTNPRMLITDIRKISEIAHSRGALVLVDNSIMSPVLSRPLELGADIVMHSATKFISGHSDVMAGILAVKGESLAKEVAFLQNAEGSGLAPFDCWLCLRGIKTMALRVEKQQANAQKLAEFLSTHPSVKKVNYAGLPGHPGHSLHYSQATGAGSVLSFLTGSLALSKHIVETTEYFARTVSFGSVRSLINLPSFTSHASIPKAVREARGLPEDLIRISVGIEDVDDLIADLDYAIRSGPV